MSESEITAPAKNRLEGIDFARAIAIVGMTVVNFSIHIGHAEGDPAWLIELEGLFSGRAAASFVFLAGVGTALLTRRARRERTPETRRAARLSLLKRGAFLFLLGVAFRAQWPWDILHFYGVYLGFAALVFLWPARFLVALAAGVTALFAALYFALSPVFGLDYWASPGFASPGEALQDLFFTGHHPVTPWFAFFLVGMAVGRIDLHRSANHWRLLIGGAILIGLAQAIHFAAVDLALVKLIPAEDWGFALAYVADMFGTSAYPPAPLYIMFGLGTGMAVLSLSLMICASAARRRLFAPVIRTGQMALTFYLLHVYVGVTAAEWFLPEAAHSVWWLYAWVAGFFVFCLVTATLWRRRFERGPVEWAMRRLVD